MMPRNDDSINLFEIRIANALKQTYSHAHIHAKFEQFVDGARMVERFLILSDCSKRDNI